MNLKILIIVPSYEPAIVYGGPIRSISALCKGLSQQGNQVDVYTTNANGPKNLELHLNHPYLKNGVRVTYFNRWTGDHSNFSPGLLLQVFRKASEFDVIHIHSWWNLVTMPAAWICFLKGIVPVISPRGSVSGYTMQHRKAWLKRIFHFAVGRKLLSKFIVHCTTDIEDLELEKWVPGSRRFIIPNLIHLPEPFTRFDVRSDTLNIVFLGRIDPVKNLEFLISMLTHLNSVPFRLTIAGEGDPQYKRSLDAMTKGKFEIDWIGEVEDDIKFSLLANNDILVLPSHTENFGNVVFESLSQGTPVIISPQVGASEYVSAHRVGWVVETEMEKWLLLLKSLWDDNSYRGEVRNRAIQCIKQDFNTENLLGYYMEMYKTVTRSSRIRTA